MKKSLTVLIMAILVIFAFSANFAQAVPPKVNLLPSDYDPGISWAKAVNLKKPVVVNFYVDWCGYCKRFAPILDKLRQEYQSKYTFVFINTEKPGNKKIADDFMINGYPSLFLVNPKNDNRVFVNQRLYSDPKLLKKEFDRFLRVNK